MRSLTRVMDDIQIVEQFIQTIFGAFVSVLISMGLKAEMGLLLFNPFVLMGVVILLIAIGYVTWYLSELELQREPSVEQAKPARSGKKSSIVAEATLVFSVGLGAFLNRDETLLNIITSNWMFSAALVAGMVFFYLSALLLFQGASLMHPAQKGAWGQQEKINVMTSYLNNFVQELILAVPAIFLGSYLINSAIVRLVIGYEIFFFAIGIASAVALYNINVADADPNMLRRRELHHFTALYRLNTGSKKLIVRLTAGILLTLLASVLLVHAGLIVANQSWVLAMIAVTVFSSQIYLLVSKFKATGLTEAAKATPSSAMQPGSMSVLASQSIPSPTPSQQAGLISKDPLPTAVAQEVSPAAAISKNPTFFSIPAPVPPIPRSAPSSLSAFTPMLDLAEDEPELESTIKPILKPFTAPSTSE